MDIVSGNDQVAPVGTELPEPLVIQIVDANDQPVVDQIVNFVVTDGGGHVYAGTASTNEEGLAQEHWTLGPTEGTQTVEARAVHASTGEKLLFDVFEATAIQENERVADVTVTPESVGIEEGETQQLTATATNENGDTVTSRPVTWSSDDTSIATVSSEGLVTAIAEGSATITADVDGVQDGASVTVTAPSDTGGSGSIAVDECADPSSTWIFCDDFEQDRLSSYFEYDDADGQFVRASNVGVEGSSAMRAEYVAGEVGAGNLKLAFGETPDSYVDPVDDGTQNHRDVYWRVLVRYEDDWTGGGGRKLTRATIFADSDWSQAMIAHLWSTEVNSDRSDYLVADPASGTDESGNLMTNGYNDFDNLRWLERATGETPLFDQSNVGQWYCIEAHVQLNSAGSSDGLYEFWVDGNLEAQQTDLNWVGDYDQYGINVIFLENYWDDGAPQTQERYIDNFVVSTQRIGCGDGTPDNGDDDPEPVASVAVSPSSASLEVGDTQQFEAALEDAEGNPLTGRTITWSSSDNDIASVGSDGLVTAQSAGSTTITATSEGVSDSADVTVNEEEAPVASVTVSPSSASLDIGGTQQFEATLQDAEGNTLTGRDVSWSSSNTGIATVDSDGVVTAQAAGSATITAISESVSDSADVSVTDSSGDGGDGDWQTHEPSGFTFINERNFDSKASSSADGAGAQGWNTSEADSEWTIASDDTAPISPDNVGQMMYPEGMSGGSSPQGQGYLSIGNQTVIYHRFYMKLSSNFHGHRTGTNKMFHVWAGNQNYAFYSADGSDDEPLQFDIHLQGTPDFNGELEPNLESSVISRGEWHQIEVITNLNSPGESNGRFQVWVDGVKTHDHQDLFIIESDDDGDVGSLQWSPTWGGVNDTLPETQYLWLDHNYVSGAAE